MILLDGAADPISPLLQFGIAGIFIALLAIGVFVPKRMVDSAEARAAEWRAAWQAEVEAHRTDIAALTAATAKLDAATEATAALTRVLATLGSATGRAG